MVVSVLLAALAFRARRRDCLGKRPALPIKAECAVRVCPAGGCGHRFIGTVSKLCGLCV